MPARSLLVPLMFCAAPLAAQEQAVPAKPSVEGYLCTFAGKCGDAPTAPEVTRDAPETKGFRLARPAAAKASGGAATSVRPAERAAVARPRSGRSATPSYGTRPARAARTATPVAAAGAAAATAGRPRADLMIGFELNSAQLSVEGAEAARVFAQSLLLPELRDKRFLIEGHTDVRGGRVVNDALSARRAQAVADFLASEGVERSRLEARGFGSRSPLPGRRAGDPANRRVEAELIP